MHVNAFFPYEYPLENHQWIFLFIDCESKTFFLFSLSRSHSRSLYLYLLFQLENNPIDAAFIS